MYLTSKEIEQLSQKDGELADPMRRMDFFYRNQRHSYDWTRAFYLWGRDTMLQRMARDLPHEASVVEVGCGTARNLIALARRQRRHGGTWRLQGLDASALMLETAAANIARAKLGEQSDRISLRHGLAGDWSYAGTFALAQPVDAVLFSYSLSMIEDWQGALAVAIRNLRPGGFICVVDFGDQGGMPRMYRQLCDIWFHHFAFHRLFTLPDYFRQLERDGKGKAEVIDIGWGHAVGIVFYP